MQTWTNSQGVPVVIRKSPTVISQIGQVQDNLGEGGDPDKFETDFAFLVQHQLPRDSQTHPDKSNQLVGTAPTDFGNILGSPISGTISSDMNIARNFHAKVQTMDSDSIIFNQTKTGFDDTSRIHDQNYNWLTGAPMS